MNSPPVSGLPRFVFMRNTDGTSVGEHEESGYLMLGKMRIDRLYREPKEHQLKFELEKAKTGEGLFHIKSCCSNTYWQREGPDSVYLKAGAAVPNENQSDASCTLFKPVEHPTGSTTIQLQFVHSPELFVCNKMSPNGDCLTLEKPESPTFSEAESKFPSQLPAGKVNPPRLIVSMKPAVGFKLTDWESVQLRRLARARTPVLGLPQYAVLKCNFNNKYLQLKSDTDCITADGNDALSPNCKFELETTEDQSLNIRSCYSSKYWAMVSPATGFIKAVVNKLNQDHQSKEEKQQEDKEGYYTLFQPILVSAQTGDAETIIRLRFVQSQQFVAYSRYTDELFLSDETIPPRHSSSDVLTTTAFTVIDCDSFVRLPQYVAFKGDNGKYLAVCQHDKGKYVKFESSDLHDDRVAHEIIYTGDGRLRIMSRLTSKFWSAKDDGIRADLDTLKDNKDTLFAPFRVAEKSIALRNLGKTLFCEFSGSNLLTATASSPTKGTHLTVEEIVLSRSISNIQLHQAHARYYDETEQTMVTREASNSNSVSETVQLKLSFKQTNSHTYTRGRDIEGSVKTTFKTGIKFLAEGEIDVTVGDKESWNWGDTTDTSSETETTHVVTVPPNSRVKVSLVATKGKCDVPFSYTQHDVLLNSEHRTLVVDDGMYTGINTYNVRYETQKYTLLCQECLKDVPDPLCTCTHQQKKKQKMIGNDNK